MANQPSLQIVNFLTKNGIAFEAHDHKPILTVEEGQKIAASIGSLCCKSLLVKSKNRFFLFVMESHKRFNSKEAAAFLKTGHLSFASKEELSRLMRTFPGAVSLLGLIYDPNKSIELVIDKDILNAKFIDCHPNRNDCSLKLPIDSIKKLLSVLQRDYLVF